MGTPLPRGRPVRPTPRRIDVRTTIGDILPYRHHVTHGWDKYPAKMVPHLARYAIERVSTKTDLVLDPFCGCGTVQIESALLGRQSIGVDVNPLAVLLAKAKSAIYRPERLLAYAADVVAVARERLWRRHPFEDWLDYWFTPVTLQKLLAIRASIADIMEGKPAKYRDLLEASLAVSVRLCSRADPRSPKPFISKRARERRVGRHYDSITTFYRSVERLAEASQALLACMGGPRIQARTILGDSRGLSTDMLGGYVDSVVTSPPYLSAQDYYRSSKLELAILGPLVQMGTKSLGSAIVGSGRGEYSKLDWNKQKSLPSTLKLLRAEDERSARLVVTYLDDMRTIFGRIRTVLKPSGRCCMVVGDSTLRGICLPVHKWMIQIGEAMGFRLLAHEIDFIRDRRLPPKRLGHSSLIDCEHLLFFGRASQVTQHDSR